MAVEASSLLVANGGQIAPALYGNRIEDDVLLVLDAYLTKGYDAALVYGIDAVDADEIATAWAMHCFYLALLDQIAIQPASVDVKDSVSTTWTTAQMQVFEKRAAYWLSLYTQAVEAATPQIESSEGWASVKSLRY